MHRFELSTREMHRISPLLCLILCFCVSKISLASPANPFEIATHLEARLAAGDGVLMPDAGSELVRFAGSVDLETGDWPEEFRSRAGREICIFVSPATGFYEFSDGTGDSFWTVVPAAPAAGNWVAPLHHADPGPHADDGLFEPWRLVDIWFLSGEGSRSGLTGRAREPGTRQLQASEPSPPRTSPPEPAELRFTSFAYSEHTLSFAAAWPAGETLPGQILDLWERLHELGYIEYFDENIAIEVIDCPNVAPEVKSK